MGDAWDSHDGQTHALPVCATHPPFSEWSRRDLIYGRCPKCGQGEIGGTWRALIARRLIEERGES